jgi:hypothetical protein
MQAFVLERLLRKGWSKGGELYWTEEDATQAGRNLIRQKLARQVRVLSASVELIPVVELPLPKEGDRDYLSSGGGQ